MNQKVKIISSKDGSNTLFLEELDETYHSVNGAIQESDYVFIQQGLNKSVELFSPKKIKILEVGFGTGLNVLLLIKNAILRNIALEIHTIEKFPLSLSITEQLNYPSLLSWEKAEHYFKLIHDVSWNKEHKIHPLVQFKKNEIGLMDYHEKGFDLILYDAFAPSKQAEMWSFDSLEHMKKLTNISSVFVTYCAKGQVRRDLASLGYNMERLPGPPGKLQMLRGTQNNNK